MFQLLHSGKRIPVLPEQEDEWAPEPVWTLRRTSGERECHGYYSPHEAVENMNVTATTVGMKQWRTRMSWLLQSA